MLTSWCPEGENLPATMHLYGRFYLDILNQLLRGRKPIGALVSVNV